MSMYKHVDVGSWDFGMKTAGIIPVSSRGLTGADGSSFFEKRAGSHQFKEVLDKIALVKDEVPMHLIAMGATEGYGSNRNSDGFTRAMLKRSHPTFVSNARVYYNHENKDPKKAFGKVAASLYNDEMDRVELLVLLNGSKEAAEKNGGKVAPKEDIEALYRGEELPWSMGVAVPGDFCNNCNNKAATTAFYCEEHECINKEGKQRFGCKHGLGKVAEDGFVQYVDNPEGRFNDISRVTRPADRTAYGAIAKYASQVGERLGGAALALSRGYGADGFNEKLIKTADLKPLSESLTKLAIVESALRPSSEVVAESSSFARDDVLHPNVVRYGKAASEAEKYAYLMHLADRKIVLSPKQFAEFNQYKTSEAYRSALSGLFGKLESAELNRTPLLYECRKYACDKRHSSPAYVGLYPLTNYFTEQGVRERIVSGVLDSDSKPFVKSASEPTEADMRAAVEYCLYKVAAVTRLNDELSYVAAAIQNF